ncbi:exodeoxyribonuclease isoform X2 [Coccinella septempunctata]|nr:exodeoxyribonuclease isoform X2 [Coccinella septempunctata]
MPPKRKPANKESRVEEEPPKKRGRVRKYDQTEQEDEDAKEKPIEKKRKLAKSEKKETSKEKEQKNKKDPKEKSEETVEKQDKPAKKQTTKNKKTTEKESVTANTTTTQWDEIDFKCGKKNAEGKAENFRITSWNVDGMKAWLKKDGLNILTFASPDILCLQETRCNVDSIPSEIENFQGYKKYWCSSEKNGYAGVGMLTKKEPINVIYGIGDEDQDEDGRSITAEFDSFYLVTVYVPNAGRKLVTLDKRLKWNNIFKDFIKQLDKKKPVIVCGDLNVAHNEIDLANPKPNMRNAGFTQEERDGMTDFLQEGFIDTFREFYPDRKDAYTFWTYMNKSRTRNIGWRLDYFLVSERFKNKVCDSVIHDKVYGSDHCPLTLFVNV